MFRSYSFVLRPLAAERSELHRWRAQCCEIYNAALEQRIRAWKTIRKSISFFDQNKELTDLRKEAGFGSVSALAQRSALRRLDLAFKAFFRRCKRGETPGFPRFRARDRYDSFGIGRVTIDPAPSETGSGYVRVPKLGRVRFKQHRLMRGEVRDVELRYEACKDRWFVRIVCDIGDAPEKRVLRTATGIDLGLKEFAVLSDGEAIANPRHFRQGAESLARAQRVLALKKRGSNSRYRARRFVQAAHRRIANRRQDFHRKLAVSLCKRFDLIAHEDLNIKGLARSALAKSVSDVAWGMFIRTLHSKAEEAGVHVVAVDPRNTTQACSQCGRLVPKALGDRVHACDCGCVLDRDHNAAINVLVRGLRAVPPESAARAFGGSVHF
jgi:putative transposase